MENRRSPSFVWLRAICPGLAFAFLLFNGAGMLLGLRFMAEFDENRELAPAPVWQRSLPRYLRDFDAYVKDNFPLRKPLLLGYNLSLYYGFHSSSSARVIVGREGWVFGADYDSADGTIGSSQLSVPYMRHLQLSLEERADWLAERGIAFCFVFFPTKTTVYGSKFLPRHVRLDDGYTSAARQFARALGPRLASHFVPVEEALHKAAATADDYYYRTDTHATHEGAYLAIEEIRRWIAQVHPEIALPPYPEFEYKPDLMYPTAYGRIMGVPFREFSRVRVPLGGFNTRIAPLPDALARTVANHPQALYMTNSRLSRLKAVLLGDSFTNRMNFYMGESFGELLSLNLNRSPATPEGKFPIDVFRAFAPDLVVMTYVESRMVDAGTALDRDAIPLVNPDDVRQSRLRRLFAAATGPVRVDAFKPFVSNERVAFEVVPNGGPNGPGELLLRLTYRGREPIVLSRDDLPGALTAEAREIRLGPEQPTALLFLPRAPTGALGALRTDRSELDPRLLSGEAVWIPAERL